MTFSGMNWGCQAKDASALKQQLTWGVALLVCASIPACKSHPLGPYVSPRVKGEVVAADNGRQLAGVRVSRGRQRFNAIGGYPKGGELLMAKAPAQTGPEGHFALPSERVLSVVRGSGWNEVNLTFEKAGYYRLQTNFPSRLATNSETGEPILDLGTVRLKPIRE